MTRRRSKAILALGSVLSLLVITLGLNAVAAQSVSGVPKPLTIDERIDRMGSDERIAQLMITAVSGTKPNADFEKTVAGWRVGGVVLYASNLRTVAQMQQLTMAIRDAAGPVPPFIAIDQEGGIVRRAHAGVPVVPSHMALGAAGSADLARRAGFAVGTALRNLGFTMNFAPVLDVLPESGPAELGTRAFSNQPRLVADLGTAFMEGQRAAGIISVGKHFPGQGRTTEDTHHVLPALDVSYRDLDARDLLPFRLAIERGLPMVMTGHVALPQITGKSDVPATLSHEVMTTILRKQLRFEGVAISDALEMKAFSPRESAGNMAVQAVLAGCDMVLVAGSPQQRQAVYDALRRAYRDGTLTESRIRESLRRILTLKATRFEQMPAEPADPDIERLIARRAVTVIGDRRILATVIRQAPVYVGPAGEVRRGIPTSRAIILPPHSQEPGWRQLGERATAALADASAWIAVAQTDQQWQFIEKMSASFPHLPLVYVNLGSPYRTVDGPRVVTVLTYSSASESQQASVDVINGITEATGVIPVTPGARANGSPETDTQPR